MALEGGNQTVQMTYEAVVRGQEKIEQLARANQDLAKQVDQYKKKIEESKVSQEKNSSAMAKARAQIQGFRKEMFAASFAVGAVAGAFALLGKHSEGIGSAMERLGKTSGTVLGAIGDAIHSATTRASAFIGALSAGAGIKQAMQISGQQSANQPLTTATQIGMLSLEADAERIKGNESIALQKRQIAERLKLQNDYNGRTLQLLMESLDAKQKAETEAFRKTQQIELLSSQAATAKARGDDLTAMLKQQEAERVKLFKDAKDDRQKLLEEEILARQAAERESFRLSELGLERHSQIVKNYAKDVVASMQTGTSDAILSLMQGNREGIKDAFKGIITSIQRNIADAISKSLFTSLAGGGGGFGGFLKMFGLGGGGEVAGKNQTTTAVEGTTKAVERTAQKIDDNKRILDNIKMLAARIAECTCSTAQSIRGGGGGFSGTMTATMTPAKSSLFDKIGAVAGLAGSLGGLGGFGKGGGATAIPGLGGGPPAIPDFHPILTIPSMAKMHSGGWVQGFASGGEVNIGAQQGEFVVRRSAAQNNKDTLREINSGGKPTKGAQNVFLIKTNDAQSFAQMLSSPSAQSQIETQVIRKIMANGQIRDIIKNFAR